MTEETENLWCESCDEGRPSDASFCQKCGAKVTVRTPEPEPGQEPEPTAALQEKLTPAPKTEPLNWFGFRRSDFRKPSFRPLTKRQKVLAVAIVSVLVIGGGTFGVVSAVQQQREEQLAAEAAEKAAAEAAARAAEAAEAAAEKARLEAETLIVAFGQGQVESFLPSCEQVAGLTSAEEEKWSAAVAAFDGISDPREASRALDTVRSANGTLEDADVQAYLDGFQGGVAESLGALFDSSSRDEQAPDSQIAKWEEQWFSLSREACPEEFDVFDSTFSSLQASAARFSRMSTLASQVPWYPEGFDEWNSEMAYRSVSGRLDCYRCKGLVYEFLPRYGCSSLYVEANHLDSERRVYDWSNDTANNLDPGQSVFLEFYSYSYPSGSTFTRITEVICR
jgi:hypothetical protein